MALVVFEYFSPKEPDWTPSFSKEDKIPFGDYVVYQLLPDIFPKSNIKINTGSIYNFKTNNSFENTSLIFNTDKFDVKKVNLDRLLEIAAKGAKIFISASDFSNELSDTLKFKTAVSFDALFGEDSLPVNFVHPKLKVKSGYFIGKQRLEQFFSNFDTSKVVVLGTIGSNNEVNFIKIPYGKGAFYLHTLPLAFTNYNILLRNNAEYVFKTLSYVSNRNVIWDENYKPGKKSSAQGPLSYISKNKALRHAYQLVLLIAVLYFLVNAKRKQRAIPVIELPKNSSLEFAGTLANLYLNNTNHRDILLKRYLFWTDFLREKYYLSTESIESKDAADIISQKTGAEISCIKEIIRRYKLALNNKYISAEKLIKFNKLLEKFYLSRI
ncbi:MAG: hypothetical protein L3J74_13200 [Bacteroidales bacterium]|nr:hypothetical protein [Bacteroidales bacterium]